MPTDEVPVRGSGGACLLGFLGADGKARIRCIKRFIKFCRSSSEISGTLNDDLRMSSNSESVIRFSRVSALEIRQSPPTIPL
jgi:hypothetical protein